MILIFAAPNDIHALVVQERLENSVGRDACILDPADYPTLWHISSSEREFTITHPDFRVSEAEVEGAWLRRLRQHTVAATITDREVRKFCHDEARDQFISLVGSLPNAINAYAHEVLAVRKPFQLRIARAVGLAVPATLVSSDPHEIREFYEAHGQDVVFKILTTTRFQLTETRRLQDTHLSLLSAALHAPTIFQKRVQGRAHIRATVVDEEVYSARIEPRRGYAQLDWRLDPDPVITEHQLPPQVNANLIELHRRLGLRYGAADMMIDENGTCVFLETNPVASFSSLR